MKLSKLSLVFTAGILIGAALANSRLESRVEIGYETGYYHGRTAEIKRQSEAIRRHFLDSSEPAATPTIPVPKPEPPLT